MDKQDDGGPAFPHTQEYIDGDGVRQLAWGGMSLRDYFAGQALAGMGGTFLDIWVSSPGQEVTSLARHVGVSADAVEVEPEETVARACYTIADAMLAVSKEQADA